MAARGQQGVSIEWQKRQIINKLNALPKVPAAWWFTYDPEDEDRVLTAEDRRYIALENERRNLLAQLDALSPSSKARRLAA